MTEQEKQRTIGQEIILSRMIKCINEDAKITGLPLIGTGKITRWFGIEARKVQNMMDLCASLEKTKIAKEVAGRAQVHELYALRVIVDLGEGILKGMWKSSVDSITDACNGYYRLAYGEREIPDAAGFKEMIEQLRHIVVDRIGDALDKDYDWDVIIEASDIKLSLDEYEQLKNFIIIE